jgi:hypothetical protein
MKTLPRIVTAEPVIHGVLKLVFTDGYEGVVHLRPLIARGRVFRNRRISRNSNAKNTAIIFIGSMKRDRKSIWAPTVFAAKRKSKPTFTD